MHYFNGQYGPCPAVTASCAASSTAGADSCCVQGIRMYVDPATGRWTEPGGAKFYESVRLDPSGALFGDSACGVLGYMNYVGYK